MKKLFVSVPTNGRTEEDIEHSIKCMHDIAETMVGEPLEIVNDFSCDDTPAGVKSHALYFMANRIASLSLSDYMITFGYSACSKRCDLERDAARAYGVSMLTLDVYECAFMKDYCDGMSNAEENCMCAVVG